MWSYQRYDILFQMKSTDTLQKLQYNYKTINECPIHVCLSGYLANLTSRLRYILCTPQLNLRMKQRTLFYLPLHCLYLKRELYPEMRYDVAIIPCSVILTPIYNTFPDQYMYQCCSVCSEILKQQRRLFIAIIMSLSFSCRHKCRNNQLSYNYSLQPSKISIYKDSRGTEAFF